MYIRIRLKYNVRVSCIRNCALVGRTNSRPKKRRSLRYGRKSVFRALVAPMHEFVRMLARRAFNCADAGPYPSLHNLAPHYDRPTKGYQFLRDLVSKSPDEGKV
ncbi:hypothetical protein EVAR_87494_1 [Eumeta japonica]|uniref:Uncharacterized protein n=1 Tax=Eumeta variegata TaxID=151549 RepID=A0A4C1W0G3_EUMVA|nr:hypothetical protein EVAR_87494_1 [Eumeta japonica]